MRISSPLFSTLDGGSALAGRGKGDSKKHPGMSKSTKKRWTALPTLSASGAHHVREFLDDVREFRLHISLAFADRRRGVLPLPERRVRARAPACPPCSLFHWGPRAHGRSTFARKLIEEGKEEEKHLYKGVQPCRSCRSRSVRTRGAPALYRVIAARALDTRPRLTRISTFD